MPDKATSFYFIGWPATFKRWGWYFVISIILWGFTAFLNQGFIDIPKGLHLFEVVFTTLFLESLHWVHLLITQKISPVLKKLPPIVERIIEVFCVWLAGLLCLLVFNFLPNVLVFGELVFSSANTDNLRVAFTLGPITSIWLYYFVEKVRLNKRLQEEELRVSNLEKENYQAQLQTLKSQLSPHFLFNNLNVLASIIPNDSEKALEYTFRLSDLYRYYLQSTEKELVVLEEELKMLDAYRYLLETRFEERVEINFDIADKLGYLPFGAIQECVDNAIKHNAPTKQRTLSIHLARNQNTLSISNNKLPRKNKAPSTGTGWQNIVQRYQLLSKQNPKIEEDEQNYTVVLPLLKKPDV